MNVEGFNLNYMNFVLNPSAVQTQSADAGFSLYPNPVQDEFTLVYNAESNSAKMEIFTLQGTVVLSDVFTTNAHISTKYNVSTLQKGIYIVKVTDGGKLMTRKLVVK